MDDLIKIREISLKYDISARTLRYYEDIGLIKSIRSEDYAYRMYDENSIKRLEQILILRKLNISVKDIQRIFGSDNSEVILEVLSKKVTDIDDKVALLHELKQIVLDFIKQIENFDFQKDTDIKLLYEKAKEIERTIVNVDYRGKPSPSKRLIDITDKLDRQFDIQIEYLPPMRVLSSFTKESYIEDGFYYTSDVNGFFKWVDTNLPLSSPNSHEVFDFQNTFIRDKYQPAAMKKISSDFINDSPYVDYIFGGGLFAVTYAYEDEDIGAQHNRLINNIEKNSDYEIDYLPNGNQRHESLGETVISPDISRNKLAIYIPVRKRSNSKQANKENYGDLVISGINIGRTEPSAETYKNLMLKLHNRIK